MIVDECLNVFRVLNSFAQQANFSFETRLKNRQNIVILQPIVDFFNKEIVPIQQEIIASIPAEVTSQEEKNKFFNAKLATPEIQQKILPLVNTKVEAELLAYTQEELKDSHMLEQDISLFERVGLLKISFVEKMLAKIKHAKEEAEEKSESTVVMDSLVEPEAAPESVPVASA